MKVRGPVSLVLFPIVLCSILAHAQNHGATVPDRAPHYVPNQLLVRFKPTASSSVSLKVHRRAGATVRASYSIVPGLQLVQLQAGTNFNQALNSYRSDPSVLYAEPNYIRKPLDSTPNDLYYPDLWNLHNSGQKISFPYPTNDPSSGTPGDDIHALEAWAITTGSPKVVIGLIDTGIDYNHEDLSANVYRNTADCNNNGIDDDGNGYIDDCYGIDTLDNTSDPMDQVGHGTHVAGIMGAVGNNGIGVTGVNWNVRILTCKFISFNGGTDDGAIACLNYMATMKDRGVNIVATNNSWGGYGFPRPSMTPSMRSANAAPSLSRRPETTPVITTAPILCTRPATRSTTLFPSQPAPTPTDSLSSLASAHIPSTSLPLAMEF